jgi:hypothetical protein
MITPVLGETHTIADDNLVNAGEVKNCELVMMRQMWTGSTGNVAQLNHEAKGTEGLFPKVLPVPSLLVSSQQVWININEGLPQHDERGAVCDLPKGNSCRVGPGRSNPCNEMRPGLHNQYTEGGGLQSLQDKEVLQETPPSKGATPIVCSKWTWSAGQLW